LNVSRLELFGATAEDTKTEREALATASLGRRSKSALQDRFRLISLLRATLTVRRRTDGLSASD
jgi:hypothetical protein